EGRELIAHELTHTIQQGAVAQDGPVLQQEGSVSQAPEHVQRLGFDGILDYFADKANLIPGFRMFTLILGVNPINMSPVERSAANILRAVVEFMPGGGLIVQALDKYGVFDKAGAFIEAQLASLGLSGALIKASVTRFFATLRMVDLLQPGAVWDRAKAIFSDPIDRIIAFVREVPTLLLNAIKALEIADILLLPRALLKIGAAFGNFLVRFLSWAGGTVWNLLEIIFEVVAPAVLVYLKKAQAAFKTILAN